MIGDWIMDTSVARKADAQPPAFRASFDATPLGQLSVFGVVISTMAFAVGHQPRDWPGAVVCGIAYCALLALTKRKGLGPVVWAHGITNALIWGYTLYTNDWRFL